MTRVLVLVSSSEGQTAKIGRRIAGHLHAAGVRVALRDVAGRDAGAHLASCDGIVIGGAIHYGHHAESLRRFVKEHRALLGTRHSAFFSVSLSAASPTRDEAAVKAHLAEFLKTTQWTPDLSASFAGAIRNSMYGFVKGLMVRLTLARAGRTETGDHEYTDWKAVESFAAAFARRLATPKRDAA
jgi:menaquinone-dependent protoporphyrinogen oxidase